MSIEKCPTCGGYHPLDVPGRTCSPIDAMQSWLAKPREIEKCDTCGDPTTGFTRDGAVRCPDCQRKQRS